jgi:hypothetical protein
MSALGQQKPVPPSGPFVRLVLAYSENQMERWGWRLTLNLIGLYLAGLIVVALIVWIVLALFGKTEPPYN